MIKMRDCLAQIGKFDCSPPSCCHHYLTLRAYVAIVIPRRHGHPLGGGRCRSLRGWYWTCLFCWQTWSLWVMPDLCKGINVTWMTDPHKWIRRNWTQVLLLSPSKWFSHCDDTVLLKGECPCVHRHALCVPVQVEIMKPHLSGYIANHYGKSKNPWMKKNCGNCQNWSSLCSDSKWNRGLLKCNSCFVVFCSFLLKLCSSSPSLLSHPAYP